MTQAYFDAANPFIEPLFMGVGVDAFDEFEFPPYGPPDDIGTEIESVSILARFYFQNR